MWFLLACAPALDPFLGLGTPMLEVELVARVGARPGEDDTAWSGAARFSTLAADEKPSLLPGRCAPVVAMPRGEPEVATFGVTGALSASFVWDEASGLYRVPAGRADRDVAWGVGDLHVGARGADFTLPAAIHFGPTPMLRSVETRSSVLGDGGGLRLGWEAGRAWHTELVVETPDGLQRCGTARDGLDVPSALAERSGRAWLRTVVVRSGLQGDRVIRVRTYLEREISLRNPVADEAPRRPDAAPAAPPRRGWGPMVWVHRGWG